MNYRKVTSHIVFTVITAIIVAGMVTSCSSEEYEGPKPTLAGRKKCNTERNTTPGEGVFQCTNVCENGPYVLTCSGKNGLITYTIKVMWVSERVTPNDKSQIRIDEIRHSIHRSDSLNWDVVRTSGEIGLPLWGSRNEGTGKIPFHIPCDFTVRLKNKKTNECLHDTIRPATGMLSHDVLSCISYDPIP